MDGSIYPLKDRGQWAVNWYCKLEKRSIPITRYKGNLIPITHYKRAKNGETLVDEKGFPIPDKKRCQGYKIAQKLLAQIQGRWEQHLQGICQFRIDEFTGRGWTDVLDFYKEWMEDVIEEHRKPATIKGYWSYYRNWIEPFFLQNPIRLHEIQLDTLNKFLKSIKNGLKKNNPDGNIGKTALNIMMALHRMMVYAERARRIPEVPHFPELEDYNIIMPEKDWLSKSEFWNVIDALPEIHRPPFLWIYYHFRREGEACALYKTDYFPLNRSFKVQRAISARKLVNSVKTNWKKPKIHHIPCKKKFAPIANKLLNENLDSPFLFVNPRARKEGKRYTLESLSNIWYKACDKAGVRRIRPYRGTKATSCTHFILDGGTVDELQILTQHARRDSVEPYIEITLERQRELLERR
ncbi:tyrosine-type recombinase/integrase [Thermodesulfobacteriota bacterium]